MSAAEIIGPAEAMGVVVLALAVGTIVGLVAERLRNGRSRYRTSMPTSPPPPTRRGGTFYGVKRSTSPRPKAPQPGGRRRPCGCRDGQP